MLTKHNWGRHYAHSCPIQASNYLSTIIKAVVNSICPIKLYKVNPLRPLWYRDEVIEQSLKYSRLSRINTRKTNEAKRNAAIEARNKLKTMITNAQKDFYLDYFVTYGRDTKKFWAGIGTLVGKPQKLVPRFK